MRKNYDFGTYRDIPSRSSNPALNRGFLFAAFGVLGVGAASAGLRQKGPLTAITFAANPGVFYVQARDLADQLAQPIDYDEDNDVLTIGEQEFPKAKKLINGANLIKISDAQKLGASVSFDPASNSAKLTAKGQTVDVTPGEKRVEIDKSTQRLKAYQGPILVLDTNVSTGRAGHRTPSGNFTLGPEKDRMHYSRLYDNAPMPYSVQVDGNVFIHGFSSVPSYAASHGCIRMPLNHGNPARWFFNWVDVGTPATISGDWHPKPRHRVKHRHRRRITRR